MTTIVVRRIYFYAAALLGLQLLAVGASELLGTVLEPLLAPTAIGAAQLSATRLSLSVALLLVGLPLWAVHWGIAQRMARRVEEQSARLRRLYGYLVLLIAAVTLLFALRDLLAALFGAVPAEQAPTQAAAALGSLVPQLAIWLYHWRVFSADRAIVEQAEGTATLRRWYVMLVQAISLGVASVAAVDLTHQLLQLLLAPPIGGASGIGGALALLIAALAVWLPHHLWARQLVRAPSALRADELRSTLRQVYAALVITASAVAGLGGLTAVLAALLLASFGGASWQALLTEQTWALAAIVIAAPLWSYHRRQLADEARLSAQAARNATAHRVIDYLMAAVGLVALFFGLGELLSTLLRMLLAPDVLGVGWRTSLSWALALSLVALPVYTSAALAMERRARESAAEERTLARRIYLYAALLFGIVATVSAVVALLRLVLDVLFGAAAANLPFELGRWAGYALVGAAIAAIYALLLRRASLLRGEIGTGVTVAIVAEEPLRQALVAACAREAPGATILAGGTDEPAQAIAAIGAAEVLVVTLAVVLDGLLADRIRAFGGQRLLVATKAEGYTIVGAQRSDAALVRAVGQALRAAIGAGAPEERAPGSPLAAGTV